MRGDFTRLTFAPKKHYNSVRQQQGRVQLDADWNEQVDIQAYHRHTSLRDVVGACGAPYHQPDEFRHFQVRAAGQDIEIAHGRIYVDGILCENDDAGKPVTGRDQPHLAANAPIIRHPDGTRTSLPAPAGTYLAYLDVWEREVTALQDPDIRETALGGPDTTLRMQTVWQVHLLRVGNESADLNCLSEIPAWNDLIAPPPGQLRARAEPGEVSATPCVLPPGGGYRRLENQLYRVEVHEPGSAGTATFKWSRENGSVVTEWLAQDRNDLTVASLGRDTALGFAAGQWVELTDDTRELRGVPGVLVQLAGAQGQVLTINPDSAPVPINRADFPVNPKVRRWDMPASASGAITIETPVANDGYLPLEDGVEVRFEPGGTYRTGDYWLIPARTLTADIEWPRAAGQPAAQPPHGVQHHFCRLALLRADAAGLFTLLEDCRPLFPPVTELTSFFYVGGDGQEALPAQPGQPGSLLRQPLAVGVANGQWPVAGASVQFTALPGNGTLESLDGTTTSATLVVVTGPDGVAACRWRLDGANEVQHVTATLLDAGGHPRHLPIRFGATLSVASEVGYTPGGACTNLAGVTTVQEAIDELCKTGNNVQGIHVRDVRTIEPDTPLPNDAPLPAPLLARGLRVVCDGPVAKEAVAGKRTCFVTLDMPFPFNRADMELWGDNVLGFQPLILDGDVNVEDTAIVWRPASEGVAAWLNDALFARMAELGRGNRLLAHLTLKGNFIWGQEDKALYLDGDSFGVPAGAGITGLDLPSGDNRRGGDFEMWFWLEPEAAGLKSLTIAPTAVTGGAQATGTVTLSGRAPSGGTTVTLTGNNPAVTVPSTVIVTAGQFSANFTITTGPVATPQTVTIRARLAGSPDQTATLTVNPPRLITFVLSTTQTRAKTVSGTVTLNGPAPANGIDVTLASSNGQIASVPASVRVAAGQISANLTVTTGNPGQAVITATLGDSRSVSLQVLPDLSELRLNTTAVVVGRSAAAAVVLTSAVPFNVTVGLSSTNTGVATVPSTVTVPAGQTSATFSVTSRGIGVVGITATLQGGTPRSGTLRVVPAMASLQLSPSTVQGGDDSQGTVTLASAVPFAVTIALASSNPSAATVPGTVTISPGSAIGRFTVSTAFTTTNRTVSIRAFYADIVPPEEGVSQRTATLTIVRSKLDDKILKEDDRLFKEFETKLSETSPKLTDFAGPAPGGIAPLAAPSTEASGDAGGRAFIQPEERPATEPPAPPAAEPAPPSAAAAPPAGASPGAPGEQPSRPPRRSRRRSEPVGAEPPEPRSGESPPEGGSARRRRRSPG